MVFKKDHKIVGNRAGRPRGSGNKWTEKMLEKLLRTADKVKKNKKISGGKSVLEHFCERCYKSDYVLTSFMKKIIADKNFNVNEFQGDGIHRVVFEVIDSKSGEEKRKELGEEHDGTLLENKSENDPNNNGNNDSKNQEDIL